MTSGYNSICSSDMGHRTQCRLGTAEAATEVAEKKTVSGKQSGFQPSRGFSGPAHEEEVRGHVGAVPDMVWNPVASHYEQESTRYPADRIPRVSVSRGGRPEQSKLRGSSVVQGAGYKRFALIAKDSAEHEGLETPVSTPARMPVPSKLCAYWRWLLCNCTRFRLP